MDHFVINVETGETETIPLTDEELAAQAAAEEQLAAETQVAETEQSNEQTLRTQAEAALAANRAWLKDGPFTTAGTLAQAKALTRQHNAIIRLLLGKLDGTD